jgi:hypothetical protein
MRRIHAIIVTLGLLFAVVTPLAVAGQAEAATFDLFKSCSGVESEICRDQDDQKLFGANSIWGRVINMMIFLIGAVSVVMIIVGGLRYVLSGGDSSAINGAKNTILYSIVGLAVAIMAYAIVNFVASNLAA